MLLAEDAVASAHAILGAMSTNACMVPGSHGGAAMHWRHAAAHAGMQVLRSVLQIWAILYGLVV